MITLFKLKGVVVLLLTLINFTSNSFGCYQLDVLCKNKFYITKEFVNVYSPEGDIIDINFDNTKIQGIVYNNDYRLTIIYVDKYFIDSDGSIHFCQNLDEQIECSANNADWWYKGHDCSELDFELFKHDGLESFKRLDPIPNFIKTEIANHDLTEDTNYTISFFNLDIKSVCSVQLEVFDEINGNPEGYLVEGDLVQILEVNAEWVQILYFETDITYWVYQPCFE
jgi:hypothetical protein